MAAMRAATAASKLGVQRQQWAVLDKLTRSVDRTCCNRSDGGNEPTAEMFDSYCARSQHANRCVMVQSGASVCLTTNYSYGPQHGSGVEITGHGAKHAIVRRNLRLLTKFGRISKVLFGRHDTRERTSVGPIYLLASLAILRKSELVL